MKPTHYLSALIMSFAGLTAYAAPTEPASSVMSSGHWVKVRIDDDAIYQLSYASLRELGFSSPERVNVYGYNPTLLLTHDANRIPSDLTPVHTLHAKEKILFYGKGDTDHAPELWTTPSSTSQYLHAKHAYSRGATYFLSDVEALPSELTITEAPEMIDGVTVLTDHTSMVYHEEDVTNMAEGGCWLGGPVLGVTRPQETHEFEVSKTSTGKAVMVFSSLLSPQLKRNENYLVPAYSDGITSSDPTGLKAEVTASHQMFTRSWLQQNLTLPVSDESKKYDVTFSVHPQASPMNNGAMLDFFGLLYKRKNDVVNDNQVRMYFENRDTEACFSLTGANSDSWHVWNVTSPLAPSEVGLLDLDGVKYGKLPVSAGNVPNMVIAFNDEAEQPVPEILGIVENQDFHAMETPDMLIVTSRMFLASAEKIADLHQRLQGLKVAVVDQQQIFNEYSSGNVSPEGVRRFVAHLYTKNPSRLKGLLLLGPATYRSAELLNDDAPYVVTAESEYYLVSSHLTTAFCSDTFFGRCGTLITTGNWNVRGEQLQIAAGDIHVAVGRVPLMSAEEIDNYYNKVEQYLSISDNYGSIGNVLLSSDYSRDGEEHHMSNAESLVPLYGDKANTTVTIVRAASNLYSAKDNKMVRSTLQSWMKQGVSFLGYFGHGKATDIAGSNGGEFFFNLITAEKLVNPGKYPLMYMGSCNVGPYDRTSNNLSNKFLDNPYGGAIAVIASGREVFQEQNEDLCKALVRNLNAATDGTPLGRIWCDAQQECVQTPSANRDYVINHLTYNYLGDPMVPFRAETHSVVLDEAASIVMNGENTLTGYVAGADGNADTSFNGTVKLTFYEVPEVKANVLGTNVSSNYVYYSELTLDQSVIHEVIGDVVNGRFSVKFIGPTSPKTGNHRIRAYAFSSDGSSRGLGSLPAVEFVDNTDGDVIPDAEATQIRSFAIADSDVNGSAPTSAVLRAEIYIPAGLAPASALKSAMLLTVDGETVSQVQNFASFSGKDICTVNYAMRNLTHGKHTAKIAVLDATGVWTEAETDFSVMNIPTASLSAAGTDGGVSFEVMSDMPSGATKRLVVERLNGEVALSREMTSRTETVELPAGAYRAYVQLKSSSAAASTPKIGVTVD